MALSAPFAAGIATLEVISVLSEIPTLGTMIANAVAPSSETPQNTIVRVLLGQDDTSDTSFGGNVPGVGLWDFVGNPVGHTNGQKKVLPQGTFVDIEVEPQPEIGNVQANYISITNGGDDAICVSGFTVTFPDGGKAGFNAAAVAGRCDLEWTNARNPVIQGLPNEGVPPGRCIWIDRNNSNGLRFQGFAVHLPSFSTQAPGLAIQYAENKEFMCNSGPRFRMYEKLRTSDPIIRFNPPLEFLTSEDTTNKSLIGADKDPSIIIGNPGLLTGFFSGDKKRHVESNHRERSWDVEEDHSLTLGRRQNSDAQGWSRIQKKWPMLHSRQNSTSQNSTTIKPPMYETVVISPHAHNSARALCESSTSRGTSFVSLVENLFCDMEDKLLYHTCESEAAPSSTACCYDTRNNTLLACDRVSSSRAIRQNSGSTWLHTPLNFVATQNVGSIGMQSGKTFSRVKRW